VNALDLSPCATDLPPALGCRAAKLGRLLGAHRLDGTVVDVDPGGGSEPYHPDTGRWLIRNGRGRDEVLVSGGVGPGKSSRSIG